jgi:predicted small lipoprotein YifL
MKNYLLLLLLPLICSCGQTGPLYLPGTPPPIHVKKEVKPEPDKVEKTDSATAQPSTTQE